MKISRADYMKDSKALHSAYYGQFVAPQIKQLVADKIGLETLLKSRDEHLNDIPLKRWDRIALVVPPPSYGEPKDYRTHQMFYAEGDNSLSTAICIMKQAARQLIAENAEVAQ